MRLYKHSARCPVALRAFLDCNPVYWDFIPLPRQEPIAKDAAYLKKMNAESFESIVKVPTSTRHERKAAEYLQHVPLPLTGFMFTYAQAEKQWQFFDDFLLSDIEQHPYSPLDLYQVKIIAVLPDDRSVILRYIIETLFIIHGQTMLNMICPVGADPKRHYGEVYDPVWCANLKQQPKATTTAKTSKI
ncbi:unnamed protein product [Rotaria magnacalcarata]|uniref:Uncharacterized protein n=1 Tax=Rotaria magnacalcarata TaxID=392030 RepID=A0A816GJS0_9BILA|nr:unnamed protein product [Rotaria magnacalcarata]CAF1675995.1 unnamed protein product [Rotaria magnacalcarata]CAF4025895.1 unnamed protein product [Rotaria magnacalcarata]CAF4081961.1 unnamed protein product [Rotaria magnacalcarata]